MYYYAAAMRLITERSIYLRDAIVATIACDGIESAIFIAYLKEGLLERGEA